MTGFVQSARKAALSLTCALALAGTAAAVESTADQPLQGNAPLMELNEVWVHGQSLARRIEQAEDDFFQLYNALNGDDRFDVHCGDMALHAGSMIMRRTCMPGFIADRLVISRPTVKPAFSIMYDPNGCSPVMPSSDDSYSMYSDGCRTGTGMPTSIGIDRYLSSNFQTASSYASSAPLALEALHYRQQYADTVLAVVQGDARLREKAADLAGLYEELNSTQQHYRDLKAATPAAWSFERKLGTPGPRGR